MAKKSEVTETVLSGGNTLEFGGAPDPALPAPVTSTTSTATTVAEAGLVLARMLVDAYAGGAMRACGSLVQLDPAEAEVLAAQGVVDTDPAAVAYVNQQATLGAG